MFYNWASAPLSPYLKLFNCSSPECISCRKQYLFPLFHISACKLSNGGCLARAVDANYQDYKRRNPPSPPFIKGGAGVLWLIILSILSFRHFSTSPISLSLFFFTSSLRPEIILEAE